MFQKTHLPPEHEADASAAASDARRLPPSDAEGPDRGAGSTGSPARAEAGDVSELLPAAWSRRRPPAGLRALAGAPALLVTAMVLVSACDDRPVPTVYALPAPYAEIAIDYLPFEYLPDGCSQRASYLAMELAVRGVPTIAVDAETCDMGMGLSGPFGEPWRHHTVPALLGEGGEPRLIDPLVGPEYLTIEAWLAGMTSDPVRVFLVSAAYPTSHGHETPCGSVEAAVSPLPATVAEMTPWLLENVMIDCAALRQYHRDSPVYDPTREERLVARTTELVKAVQALGLLDESMNPGLMDRLAQAPWCPEPIPK